VEVAGKAATLRGAGDASELVGEGITGDGVGRCTKEGVDDGAVARCVPVATRAAAHGELRELLAVEEQAGVQLRCGLPGGLPPGAGPKGMVGSASAPGDDVQAPADGVGDHDVGVVRRRGNTRSGRQPPEDLVYPARGEPGVAAGGSAEGRVAAPPVAPPLGRPGGCFHPWEGTGRGSGSLPVPSAWMALPPPRVFVVDDHELVRRGLTSALAAGGLRVVGEASSVAEGRRRGPAVAPDVAVVDVRLPDGDGIELCAELTARVEDLSCVVLSAVGDEVTRHRAEQVGVGAYLMKRTSAGEVVDTVWRVAAGDPPGTGATPGSIPGSGSGAGAEPAGAWRADPLLASLSDQEMRILGLLAAGMTNREMAGELYLAEKTVKNYVSNLLAKLGMARRTEAAVYAARLEERHRRLNN